MAIPKYKDPVTGKWNRITTYGQSGNAVELTEISGETALSDDIIAELKNDLNWISYGGGAYRFVSTEEDKRLYSYITEDKISQILVNTSTKTCALRETQITAASVAESIVKRDSYGEIPVSTPSRDSSATNKAYVDDADKLLRLKLSNLEQALNGYVLDTTEEAYADLDSAVLKNNVTVGDNVYPITDKTRALVTRIEGKTTKMVQLLDKSKYYKTQTKLGITATNNGDGSWTINGTATASAYINFSPALSSLLGGHKVLICGNKENSNFHLGLLNQSISDIGTGAIGIINQSVEKSWGISWKSGAVINNVTITPQLFDLTAMNREDITTVEQFKAEFPDLYPYENGNIYPAKISGVKFTGKNLLKLELEPSLNAYNATASINGDILSITPTITELKTCYAQLKTHLKAGKYTFSAVINNPNNVSTQFILSKKINAGDIVFRRYYTAPITFTIDEEQDFYILIYPIVKAIAPFKTASYQMQIQAESQATAYEPYTEPVSVTLPETYDLHGIGDYKDYLEITKNENNELYTLKKVQSVEVNESEKTITPLATPVETVIATNLAYEQVTAIRHNGGLLEVVGNTNKAYAKPTIKNTVVYRLTATNTAEG